MSIIGTVQSANPIDPASPEGTAPEQAQPVEHDWQKRYTDLQSYKDKEINGLKDRLARSEANATVFTPPKTAEELEAFGKQNPDWMGVIETAAHNIVAKNIQPIQEELNLAKANTAAAELLAVHPDVGTLTQTPDFNQWATEQGPEIQAWLADELDASKVIRAINYYKAMRSTNPVVPTHPQDLSAAQAVSTHGSVVTPQTSEQAKRYSKAAINKMHPDEYERNYEAIKFASRNGLLTD